MIQTSAMVHENWVNFKLPDTVRFITFKYSKYARNLNLPLERLAEFIKSNQHLNALEFHDLKSDSDAG